MKTTTDHLDTLYHAYIQKREIPLHKHQFIHLLKIYPALVVLMSDGVVDKEERLIMNIQASKLGYDYATEDLGIEKEENLMLIYRAEFRYLIKNRHDWERKFLDVLKEYLKNNDEEKSLVKETMQLFASASQGTSIEEEYAIGQLKRYLDLGN